jgi:hypothetical protein
LSGL